MAFATIDELEGALREADYLPDRGLATALYLSRRLEKPLLLEGEAGVGKTEAAKALARANPARLIRLQCYEGLDIAHAVYEWNYSRQLLHIRAAQEGTVDEAELFGPEFLIRRPLLEAIESEEPVVLLIDEIDRADEEFEAFLLEVLSDFQITIPEIGTIAAARRPSVILTSNRTRELHDALKRRCLFHWIGHPALEREIEIVRLRVPGIPERLAPQAARFVRGLRELDLAKPPGVAETIDWAHALTALGRAELDAEVVEQTLGSVLKYHEDLETVKDAALATLVEEARSARLTVRARPAGRDLRPGAAGGGPGGRAGTCLRRAARPGRNRPPPPRRRLLDAPPDARLARRRHRRVRPGLRRLVPARPGARAAAHAETQRARRSRRRRRTAATRATARPPRTSSRRGGARRSCSATRTSPS